MCLRSRGPFRVQFSGWLELGRRHEERLYALRGCPYFARTSNHGASDPGEHRSVRPHWPFLPGVDYRRREPRPYPVDVGLEGHDRPDCYRSLHLFPGTDISVQGGDPGGAVLPEVIHQKSISRSELPFDFGLASRGAAGLDGRWWTRNEAAIRASASPGAVSGWWRRSLVARGKGCSSHITNLVMSLAAPSRK